MQCCVCVVDAMNFLKVSAFAKAPAAQVKSADIILINKTDLVNQQQVEKIEQAVRNIAEPVPFYRTAYCDFPLEILDSIHRPRHYPSGILGDGQTDAAFSLTLEGVGEFTANGLEAFVVELMPILWRLKGFVFVDGKSYYIDEIPDHWSRTPFESIPPKLNRLVFISNRFDRQIIEREFNKKIQI